MKTLSFPMTIAAAACLLASCGQADRTTSVPRGVDTAAATVGEPSGPSAPLAPAERTPIAPNANTMAPGTDASMAFATPRKSAEGTEPDNDPQLAARAQDAAARSPDTASADAAKQAVLQGAAQGPGTGAPPNAQDSNATLSKGQESNAMPTPGQANDHSTTARDKDGKQ